VKPDDGAGAEATRLFRRRDEMQRWLAAAPDRDSFVVQPFVEGVAASLSLLCQDGRGWLLSCNRQEVAIENGAFRFCGSVVGGLEQRRPLLGPIAAAVASAMPDLWGYVGIDFIDSAAGPLVLESILG
jgi:predicted ATP-grasp superfamily ATP-dependent carboligase